MSSKWSATRIAVLAVLCAMEVVLSRITAINIGNYLKIGFGFIPVAVCGIMYGAVPTVVMAVVADVIGALLFPSGPFFPGFTLVAAIGGLIYGLFLYRKKPGLLRAMLCCATVALVCNITLNTVFLCMTGAIVGPENEAFWPLMWTRVIKNAVQFPVNAIILSGLWPAIDRLPASIREG